MISPAAGAGRLAAAFLLGLVPGLLNEFLRPLRKKRRWPADLLLTAALFWMWLVLACAVCDADPRIWDTGVFFLGAAAGAFPLGKLLRPVFRCFWNTLQGVFSFLLYPIRKFLKFLRKFSNFLYAKRKKWGTINRKDRHGGKKIKGGDPHVPPETTL